MYHVLGATVVTSIFTSLDWFKSWRICIWYSKKWLLKLHSCFLSSTLGHRGSFIMVSMKTKEKKEENRTGIIHIKYVETSTLGQKAGHRWKRLGLPLTDQSAASIHHAFGALGRARFCTVAIDESLRPNLHPIPPSVSGVSYRKPVPLGLVWTRASLLSNQFHTFMRGSDKSAALAIESKHLQVTRASLWSRLRSFSHLSGPSGSSLEWSFSSDLWSYYLHLMSGLFTMRIKSFNVLK